jgi:hypothetical protein
MVSHALNCGHIESNRNQTNLGDPPMSDLGKLPLTAAGYLRAPQP